jgi:hypothetical protein
MSDTIVAYALAELSKFPVRLSNPCLSPADVRAVDAKLGRVVAILEAAGYRIEGFTAVAV